MFPFARDPSETFHSNLIVNILIEDSLCLTTRKRVPYKIVLETIDIGDMDSFSPKKLAGKNQDSFLKISDDSYDNHQSPDQNQFVKKTENYSIFKDGFRQPEDDLKQRINKYSGFKQYAKQVRHQEEISNFKETSQIDKTQKEQINIYEDSQKKGNHQVKLSPETRIYNRTKQFNYFFPINIAYSKRRYSFLDFKDNVASHPNNFSILSQQQEISFAQKKSQGGKRKRCKSVKEIHFHNLSQFLDSLLKNSAGNTQRIQEIQSKVQQIYQIESKQIQQYESDQCFRRISTNKFQTQTELPKMLNYVSNSEYHNPWGMIWEEKQQLVRSKSSYGHFPSYKLRQLIIKGGDDLRQEIIAMQLIQKFQEIFKKSNLTLYLRPYEIIVTSANSGILEFIPNTISLDQLKKSGFYTNLKQFYLDSFGGYFEEAQKNFIESLAGYSLVSYLLNIKDRHNGNILIDCMGHIIHIDYGFMLGITPGGISFEQAPFKLTSEFLELMGGRESNMFMYFKILLLKGFMELRKFANMLVVFIQIMMKNSDLPCFQSFDFQEFRSRFLENSTDQECMDYVEKIIDQSADNWRTIKYDQFQKMSNGIMP